MAGKTVSKSKKYKGNCQEEIIFLMASLLMYCS